MRIGSVVARYPNVPFGNDDMFCRRSMVAQRIYTDDIARKSNDTLADDALWVVWCFEGNNVSACNGVIPKTNGKLVFHDDIEIVHCWQH